MTESLLGQPSATGNENFDLLSRVSMRLSVEVGSTALTLADVLALERDAVIDLDRPIDDPLDILVNGTLIARGEVVTVDGRYGVRICEIIAPAQSLGTHERRQ